MKQYLLVIMIILSLVSSSCKKEKNEPNYGSSSTNPTNCNCGTVTQDNGPYSVNVSNGCSGNIQTFTLTSSDWYSAFVGDEICFNNVSSW